MAARPWSQRAARSESSRPTSPSCTSAHRCTHPDASALLSGCLRIFHRLDQSVNGAEGQHVRDSGCRAGALRSSNLSLSSLEMSDTTLLTRAQVVSSGYTPREAYEAVPQLHAGGEGHVQNIRKRARELAAAIEAAAPPPEKSPKNPTPKNPTPKKHVRIHWSIVYTPPTAFAHSTVFFLEGNLSKFCESFAEIR